MGAPGPRSLVIRPCPVLAAWKLGNGVIVLHISSILRQIQEIRVPNNMVYRTLVICGFSRDLGTPEFGAMYSIGTYKYTYYICA